MGEKQLGDACGTAMRRSAKGDVFSSFCLPRRDLLCIGSTANNKLEFKLDRSPVIRQAITGYLTVLGNVSETLDASGQNRLAQHTLDMVGALLQHDSTNRSLPPLARNPAVVRMQLIERYVAQNLTDPELSIGAVAAHLGVHQKQVQRLFAASGQTFADFVLDERLRLARSRLADAHGAAEKISTIAFDVGFGDLAYFNRAFRTRFGTTPSEYRSAGGVG